jgi:hypothetical protein
MLIFILMLILMIGWIYLYKKYKKLDVTDVYIIIIILTYDVLPIINLVKNSHNNDMTFQLLTLTYILLTTIAILLFFNIFIKKDFIIPVRYNVIIEQASKIDLKFSIFFFLLCMGIILYYFYFHTLIFRVTEYPYENILNHYNIIITSFVIPIFYLILLIVFSNKIKLNKTRIIIYSFMVIIIIFYFLFYSRRELILAILLIILVLSYKKKSNIFSPSKLPIVFISLILIVLASNVYQNIRFELASYALTGKLKFEKSIFEYAFDFEASNDNLVKRTTMYQFNSTLFYQLYAKNNEPTYGEIFVQNFLNATPSVLLDSKKIVGSDKMISESMNIEYTDYPTSIGGIFLVDFGMFSLILYPTFLILYISFFLYIIKLFYKDILLYLFVVVYLLYFLFNVENTITGAIVGLRNIFIIIILFKLIETIKYIILKKYQKRYKGCLNEN